MAGGDSTCWTLIDGARHGDEGSRAELAARYLPVVRAYLVARWRGTPLLDAVEDATQEVFLDVFREGGALARLDPSRPGGFRPFLYGVVRNAARHVETRRVRDREQPRGDSYDFGALGAREEELAAAFDRAWATALVREAIDLQRKRAAAAGEEALRRVELLRLRFGEDLPIREIAQRWDADPARLHKEYARARREFREALHEVVGFHLPGDREAVEEEARALLAHFS